MVYSAQYFWSDPNLHFSPTYIIIAHAFLLKSASKINSHFNTPFERARSELPEMCKISEIGPTELKLPSFKVSKSAICTGFNVNEQLSSGWTALLHACDTGHEEMVELLLERGTNPNTHKGE